MDGVPFLFGVSWVFPRSVKETLLGWRGSFVGKKRKVAWQLGPLYLFWVIWKARNSIAFEDCELSIQRLKASFVYFLWSESKLWIKDGPSTLIDFINWALKTGSFSTPQPTPQTLPSTSVATGPALPQHLPPVHPYSQPGLPLGHFANMIGYPFLPQSYTYMPSAYQQAFCCSTSIPGNFSLNPPTAAAGTTIGYDDVINSQYKDGNHLISLQQQNENSAMWVHGPGSRTMSAVPANTYYSFQGQKSATWWISARAAAFPAFWGPWVPKFLPFSGWISLEHQQQNPRDGSLRGLKAKRRSSPTDMAKTITNHILSPPGFSGLLSVSKAASQPANQPRHSLSWKINVLMVEETRLATALCLGMYSTYLFR
ncbi:hypothetical protein CK203_090340 [Vitis vinifera]|uniref:Uncharacterized protein n=1 Tax=Vitis vinifera TaxID=29760 RepID=A0A438EI52_VITVI|nr:hypothetical protein CK203_090340 [Vitis vinifera]